MKKIKLLGKLLIFIFVFTLMGNVYAADTAPTYDGSTPMKDNGYNYLNLKTGEFVYIKPLYSNYEQNQNKVVNQGGTKAATQQEGIEGITVTYDNVTVDSTTHIHTFNGENILFKELYEINGQKIDAKVTLNELYSTVNNNDIKVYVNYNENKDNHYLGFGIWNHENTTETSVNDMLKVTIQLYKSGTNEVYHNDDLVFYFNDIDADVRENETAGTPYYTNIADRQYELAQIYNIEKQNTYLASQNSLLNIKNDVISSTYNNTENGSWDDQLTQKVSLIVKGDSNLQNGKIQIGHGHYIGANKYKIQSAGSARFGATDVQFLVPLKITGKKTYASDTPNGKDHSMVVVNDEIKYNINLKPTTSWNDKVDTVVTDILSKGLKYKTGSAKIGTTAKEPTITNNSDGTTTLVWNFKLKSETNLTYSVQVVNGYENNKVSNNAVAKIGSKTYQLGKLENPLPSKAYASDTPNGKDGAKVKKDDVIKYSITYKNSTSDKQKVKITDTLSKGIKYKKNTAKIGSKEIEPKITENKDGTTTLVWEKEVAANTEENLTYSVDVVGGVSEVKNNAYLQYAKLKSGSTTEFDSYGDKINLNELRNPLDVVVPNTALNSSIYLILIGMLLIGTGAIVIRKTTKKESK